MGRTYPLPLLVAAAVNVNVAVAVVMDVVVDAVLLLCT